MYNIFGYLIYFLEAGKPLDWLKKTLFFEIPKKANRKGGFQQNHNCQQNHNLASLIAPHKLLQGTK